MKTWKCLPIAFVCLLSLVFFDSNGTPEVVPQAPIIKSNGGIDFKALDRKLFDLIADRTTPIEDLEKAILHLGSPLEKPAFWTDIADDESYTIEHRRRCIFAFFRRHGVYAKTASALAAALNRPRWFEEGDVTTVSGLGGWIPVTPTVGDRVFRIRVLSPRYAVFMNVLGQEVDARLLGRRLKGQPIGPSRIDEIMILELGVFDEVADREMRGP